MNQETDTPRTDALMPDQGHKRTMHEHILVMEAHARQLERELNEARKDAVLAAGELLIPIPRPGTDMSRMLTANRILIAQRDAAMQAIRDIYANHYNSSETYIICEKILPKEEHLKP